MNKKYISKHLYSFILTYLYIFFYDIFTFTVFLQNTLSSQRYMACNKKHFSIFVSFYSMETVPSHHLTFKRTKGHKEMKQERRTKADLILHFVSVSA